MMIKRTQFFWMEISTKTAAAVCILFKKETGSR